MPGSGDCPNRATSRRSAAGSHRNVPGGSAGSDAGGVVRRRRFDGWYRSRAELGGRLKDAGRATPAQVSMAKRNGCWVARRSAQLARETLGANGITAEYPVMRHMMNIESVYTYEGTHDMHTLIVGEEITGLSAYR